jgi:GDP-L-fucose synthase
MNINDKIYVAGHNGMVGSAIVKELFKNGFENIVTANRRELDLLNQQDVVDFFEQEDIDYVVIAAAKVGGIYANNSYPAQFIYENLMIECNIIHSAHQFGVKNLLFLGSSCIYPKFSKQPMRESELLTGVLESTNEPYAISKIAGIKLCESYNRQHGVSYRSVMPTNLYGEGDNFHPENSHVIPALLQRFHNAKVNNDSSVTIWGSGVANREFMHVNDMASACIHVMQLSNEEYEKNTSPMLSHINIGTGKEVSIKELAGLIKTTVGFQGDILFDDSKPDGHPRKLLDVSRLNSIGWSHSVDLERGLSITYKWFVDNVDKGLRLS